MFQLLKDLVSGAAAFLRFREKNQDLVNRPEMVANAEAARNQKIKDEATVIVAKGDLDELRKNAAE